MGRREKGIMGIIMVFYIYYQSIDVSDTTAFIYDVHAGRRQYILIFVSFQKYKCCVDTFCLVKDTAVLMNLFL